MEKEQRYHIKFKYMDSMSNWEWREQECVLYAKSPYGARKACIELYGLCFDCEYEITSVEEERG